MSEQNDVNDLLDALAKVLLRCFVLGFLLLLIWVVVFVLASNVIHNLHGKMFGLSEHDLNVIHYCGIAFVKLCVFLFFLFPWIAIRLVLRKRNG
jgi:hypothetical protein